MNILDIFFTFEVSRKDKFNESKLSHPTKKTLISTADEVSKSDIIIEVNEIQFSNIKSNLSTFVPTNPDKSTSVIFSHPENILEQFTKLLIQVISMILGEFSKLTT